MTEEIPFTELQAIRLRAHFGGTTCDDAKTLLSLLAQAQRKAAALDWWFAHRGGNWLLWQRADDLWVLQHWLKLSLGAPFETPLDAIEKAREMEAAQRAEGEDHE